MSPVLSFGVRTVIPFDHQSCQPFFCSPHVIGNNGDGVVEAHDLAHASDGFGCGIVNALHAPAENGRLCKGRDFHAGRPNVDAINRGAIDLRRRVEPLGRFANQREILRLA